MRSNRFVLALWVGTAIPVSAFAQAAPAADAERLMQLLPGLAQASIAVEVQGQPLPRKATYPIAMQSVAGFEPFG